MTDDAPSVRVSREFLERVQSIELSHARHVEVADEAEKYLALTPPPIEGLADWLDEEAADNVEFLPDERAKLRQAASALRSITETNRVQREALNTLSNWLVCHPIATPDDMAQSFAPMLAVVEAALQTGASRDQ